MVSTVCSQFPLLLWAVGAEGGEGRSRCSPQDRDHRPHRTEPLQRGASHAARAVTREGAWKGRSGLPGSQPVCFKENHAMDVSQNKGDIFPLCLFSMPPKKIEGFYFLDAGSTLS